MASPLASSHLPGGEQEGAMPLGRGSKWTEGLLKERVELTVRLSPLLHYRDLVRLCKQGGN